MASNCGWVNWCLLKRLRKRGSTARETCRAMRAKGRSPTAAIAAPASIENHATSLLPSRISMKLLGCQQSQIRSSLDVACADVDASLVGKRPTHSAFEV